MPAKIALVNYNKCTLEMCNIGVCAAAEACPRKLLTQEAPYEIPIADPSICRSCGDCVRACLARAIEITTM